MSIAELNDISTDYGTTFDQLKLPDHVQVTLSNGETVDMQVQWTKGAFNEKLTGHCTVYGDLVLPEGVRNPDELRARQTINVQKLGTNTAAKDMTCTYGGDAIDVSALFTIDPNAGEAAYTLIGGSGEGVLEGSRLTVTKAGDFKIRLKTEATASYQETEVTAVLTVNKGKRDKPEGIVSSNTQTTVTTDGTIAGVTEEMEYSSDSGYHWTPVQGSTITGLKSGYYQVR